MLQALELRGLGEPALAESGELVGYVPQADVVELAGCGTASHSTSV